MSRPSDYKRNWPGETIERRHIDALIPYARNARTHSDEQVAQIAASIAEWGYTSPVLVDESDMILAGHGRVLALRKLGVADVPVIVARGWDEAKKRAYIIADNKLAENAGWNVELLKVELQALADDGFALDLIGFGEDELAGLLNTGTEGLTDPDDVPETPSEPVTRPGDVWVMGRHRLLCGDSTVATDVERVLAGVKPLLMVTDPPYGVEYAPTDGRAIESLAVCGFELRSQIIWAKSNFAIGRGHYHHQHEPCWYAVREGGESHWQGDRTQSTLWQIKKPAKSETGHSTQKPVECMKRPVENNSAPGQAVYEPFSGSGTTIIAGEMTARAVHAIELNPAYVDVAVTRWEKFTGKAATLEGDGRTFAEVLAERLDEAKVQP